MPIVWANRSPLRATSAPRGGTLTKGARVQMAGLSFQRLSAAGDLERINHGNIQRQRR